MLPLRIATLTAIALWAGGIVVLGAVAAPSIFETVASTNVPDARVLAGAIFGETLRRFHIVSYVCAAVLIASLLLRRALGPPPSRFGVRLAISACMAGVTIFSGVVLSSKIERARRDAGGAPSALAENDPRRVAFGRLHGLSTIFSMVPIVGGLILIVWELRD